jgi:hypothetical protein
MPRSRSTMAGLATTAAAAGLVLTGCHSSSPAATGSATSSAPSSAAAAATASSAASAGTTVAAGGAGSVAYFPDQLGDTWVYSVTQGANKGTVTNKVTGLKPVATGTEVTMTDTDTEFGSDKPFPIDYIVHSDGSISIPLDFGAGSGFKLKSGNLGWPSPSQLASGQPQNDTIVMTGSAGGTSITVTSKAVVKGEGTQSVSVPAGSYSATVVDEVETEKVEGTPVTSQVKTWLVNGVGPVKDEVMDGTGGIDELEQLTSFTKG